ncbi:MAG TPA: methylmalonyl Co-A mutase-associated GTPase MeaB, partial [Acidimicrobiales bacterium]
MSKPRTSDPSTLLEAARDGDRVALARLLSLVERGGDGSRAVAELAYKTVDQAYTVGVTGAPGAGKSTLTDRLITLGREQGLEGPDQLAVLAIDPSSPYSGGAILGDRVRMQSHALDDGVFIRSMATRGHLGGLAVAVPDAVRLLSAVGIPLVL